ncbi:hypothetical protein Patl1_17089 [Pistacia atlantica]|uniref:Uncharacterized protein n=1 Tax=Pistacia atlantica TaxID=434234 RepID=A0ACC1BAX7_9ROSI|nr:hypothetical protein Patl1_17089 [Pistacia atlantica]
MSADVLDHAEIDSGELKRTKQLYKKDSLDIESCTVSGHQGRGSKVMKWSMILQLAFQSIGVVYGDIGTSPLYVYPSVFSSGINHIDDILGVLSLIFYTLTLIPLIKYTFIVLQANDNGDGGTFALCSLICRYANVGLLPSRQAEDSNVSNFQLELPGNSKRMRLASTLKSKLENSRFAQFFLFFVTLLGTSMVIGDGILTPSISVLSAVGGLKEATSAITEEKIVWISVAILVFLFMIQRLGTDKVGYCFAPILIVWFAFISGIGVYNIIKFDPTVIKAVNPMYIIDYFSRNKKEAWISLGGIILCTTGSEALFADLGHFTIRSIQLSMCSVVYPAIVLAYTGQASYLRKHPDLVGDSFFTSVPDAVYWPMFVVAVLAAVIASQAMISGTFSIIQQSLSLGCFPRVKIVHTSAKYEGQVYIPEMNYLLMLACVGIILVFRDTTKIGNAYGIAVVFVMTLTTSLLAIIMIMIWRSNILLVVCYVLIIGSVEFFYLSSVLYKFDQGGYLPLAFAAFLMTIMYVWNNVYRKKYYYELQHKISPCKLYEITVDRNFCRIPGLAMFYSELVHGIPPIFQHYAMNVPALHSVLVFVSLKSLPISKVPMEERFIFHRVAPNELNVFRCIVRYGYTDARNEEESFERMLVQKLKDFIREDYMILSQANMNIGDITEVDAELPSRLDSEENVIREENLKEEMERDIEIVEKAWNAGVVHLVGENEVVAAKGSGIGKRIMIDYAYNFLKNVLRKSDKCLMFLTGKCSKWE